MVRRRAAAATLILTVLGAWLAWAQAPPAGSRLVPPASAPAAPAATVPPVATVGGRPISRAELNTRESQAMAEYRQRLGQDVPEQVKPVIRRQLLENIIRRELLVLEAARRGIVTSDAEAEALVRQEPFFNPNGQFDARRFEAIRTGQPENFARAMQQAREQLAARKLNDRLDRELGAAPAALRAEAERVLTRASLDFLALKRSEFDGSFREPRELEVLAEYRRGGTSYRKSATAKLTVLMVDQPPLDDRIALESGAGQRWRTAMRERADSALAAARGGSSLEDLARVCGSLRREVEVTPDNFPGFWQGDARDAAAIFAARPGTLLATPVAAERGWMVVRVEGLTAAGPAPLVEVARQIRGTLRTDARLHGEDRVLRALYERERPKLGTTAWKLRYAVFDTAAVPVGEPTAAELDRWYRAHQADFSSFDAASGSIRVQPLADVREVVLTRWKGEQRRNAVRLAASRLTEAWQKGSRDRALERGAVAVREAGPLVEGATVDTSAAGRELTAELARSSWSLRAASMVSTNGAIVYHVYETLPGFEPPFEQVRGRMLALRAQQIREEEEAGARALYDANPKLFDVRNVIHYTRLVVPPPNPLSVPLTRAQVERHYREHLDRYSAPEQMRARQILVALHGAGPEADAEARAKAQDLLARVRRGEDFAELARQHSDDVATRDKGGDLGDFGRGTMLAAFEDVAFRLPPGEVSEVFRTEVGYHIVQSVSRLPLYAHELRYIYPNVGWDAALEMSDSITIRRTDSLAAAVRTPAAGRAAAARLGVHTSEGFHAVGDRRGSGEFTSFLIRLENTRVGQVVPGRGFDRATGHYIAWVDSIVPARSRDWEQARTAAIEVYRRGASQRALEAKRAEIDSLLAGGWSLDSLATLLGGWERMKDASAGAGLTGLGGSEIVDSLVFGTEKGRPALAEGQTSGWLELPGGFARVRLVSRTAPDPARVAAQAENEGRVRLEQRLVGWFEDTKKRHAVRILDPALRDTPLPPPPSSRVR